MDEKSEVGEVREVDESKRESCEKMSVCCDCVCVSSTQDGRRDIDSVRVFLPAKRGKGERQHSR